MANWFMAGGFGMFMVLAIGLGAVGYGVKTVAGPTAERLAVLRALPALIGSCALFSFGTNMWAVNLHLSDAAFVKSYGAGDGALLGILGFTEAVQTLTLGGLLAFVVVAIRVVAEARRGRAAG